MPDNSPNPSLPEAEAPPAPKPLPRVLKLKVEVSPGLQVELEELACESGICVEEVASHLLERAASGARRVILEEKNLTPSWGFKPTPETIISVPVTRTTHHKLRLLAQRSGTPLQAVTAHILERLWSKWKVLAPVIEALQQVHRQQRAELEERLALRTTSSPAEAQPAETQAPTPEAL